MTPPSFPRSAELERIFPGSSQMAQRMRAFDWSSHELGSPPRWPENLRTSLRNCLTSHFPMVLWWGPSLIFLYNDAFIPLLGEAKHPQALGQPARECWREIWDIVGPMLEIVQTTGEGVAFENVPIYFARKLPAEEIFVSFSNGPILAADGHTVDGICSPCTETTEQVVGARRLETLRKLGIRAVEDAGAAAACKEAALILSENPRDIPFAAIYLVDASREQAALAATAGLPKADSPLPRSLSLAAGDESSWPLRFVLRTHHPEEVDLRAMGLRLTGGPWPEPAEKALVLPMVAAGDNTVAGLLVVGVSTRRVLDDAYRTFFDLVASHVGAALEDARAHERERLRAEALAEADRAKTRFLSEVSHEFRTPLTLILGPLDDELRGAPHCSKRLQVAHRNSLRLLKLVNTLLDYSRVEAGRVEATYEPVDLASLTAELASNFRAAVEKAGMELEVHCPPLPEPAYVDREMWEKIVLNLLSNAFKFTLRGRIAVTQTVRGADVELTVQDTGSGIPAEALPHIFERFYRAKGTPARSQEGTGIGLALVQQLVKLHGGAIRAESVPGRGSTFTVAIPLGLAHLPAERIGSARDPLTSAPLVRPFVEEAERWIAGGGPVDVPGDAFGAPAPQGGAKPGSRARASIVWAEDNDDMRDYVRRLLQGSYEVLAVGNGQEALEAVRRHQPDLVLTDIMMPEGDGFDLLRELRADPQTRAVPVVLLSGRTGEEAHIEGREAGADDYVDKPFAARELLARIASNVNLARVRRESEQRIAALVESAMDAIISIDKDQRIVLFNRAAAAMFRCPASEALGTPIERFIPERFRAAHRQHIARFAETGATSRAMGRQLGVLWGLRADGEEFPIEASISQVELDWQRQMTVILRDITERLRQERALASLARDLERQVAEHARLSKDFGRVLEESREQLSLALQAGGAATFEWRADPAGQTCWSDDLLALYGLGGDEPETPRKDWLDCVVPEDREATRAAIERSFGAGRFDHDFRIRRGDNGEIRWLTGRAKVDFDGDGKPARLAGAQIDITGQRQAQAELEASRLRLEAILDSLTDGVVLFDLAGDVQYMNPAALALTGLTDIAQARRPIREYAQHFELRSLDGRILPLGEWPLARVLQGESFADYDVEVIRKDEGLSAIVSYSGTLVRGADGRAFLGALILRDISERKRIEARLKESEAKYRTLFSNMTEALAIGEPILDAQGRPVDLRLLEVNEAFYRETGLPGGVEGRPLRECLPQLEQFWVDRLAAVALAGQADRFDHYSADTRRHYQLHVFRPSPGRFASLFLNVTEQKQAEQRLRESEERFRLLADNIAQLAWMADGQGSIFWYNKRWFDYTGTTFEEMQGWGWRKVHHPDHVERVVAKIRHCFETGEPWEDTFPMRSAQGGYRWFLSRAIPERDGSGRVLRWFGTSTDITEQRDYEEELRKFKFFSDNANDGHVLLDEAGRIRYVNRLTCERLGYGEAELLGKPVQDVMPDRTLEDFKGLFERARRDRVEPFEAAQRRKDGSSFPVETTVTVMEFKGEWLMFAACRDITERKESERARQEGARRLAMALQAADSAVWEMDVATGAIHGEGALYTMLGYAPGELTTLADWMALIHEDDRPGLPGLIADTIAGKRDKYRFETRLRAKDGTWRWNLSQAVVTERNRDGQAVRLVGTHTDITQRKAAEAGVSRLNAELEQRIRERTAELERSNEALLHSNIELQHFAHATAHDLKTPLRSIAGFAQLLQQSDIVRADPQLGEYASLVINNTQRLQDLIESLLAYTRLDAQGLPLEPVDLANVADEAVASLKALIEASGAEVRRGHLPALPVDRIQIAQVFQNLIENGIKYNQSKPPRVYVTSEREEDEWVFSVADNGIGIDPRHHERIFEIFRRLHTYSEVPGSGIGLALCRRIVERHGGRIWVESRPGEGSTFYFTLPIRDTGG